ncbi:MAG: diguanylate cyclase [Gammaproteobacteria bacterium]|nr:diguanylate cyclase [Gammaproteobacteria bacterium]
MIFAEQTPLELKRPAQVLSVLLIDDSPIVAATLKKMLRDSGLLLHCCFEADQALAMIRGVRPAVIVLDLVMPVMSGLELLELIRIDAVGRDIPVVVLSGQIGSEIKANAFATGANDFLSKTPDRLELLARLRYHGRSYRLYQQRELMCEALKQTAKQLEERNRELKRLSNIDGLTGVANRRYLDESLASEWARACRMGSVLSVIMIDIDYFKAYNDAYGHVEGDLCLQRVAKALEPVAARGGDLLARYGGEEFTLILPLTSLQGAMSLANKLRQKIYELRIPHVGSEISDRLSISLGVAALTPKNRQSSDQLLTQADQALYIAKGLGRNQAVAFE